MTLGEKLKAVRLELGLSQRQLCGDMITRNMLSQIEHGTARPSMSTLKYLAAQLGKPVSYFLEEEGAVSRNQAVMAEARQAFDRGNHAIVLEVLRRYQEPDTIYQREKALLETLARLELGAGAAAQGRKTYAAQLLSAPVPGDVYCAPELERRRLLLLGRLGQGLGEICGQLPSLDEELLLRCRAALAAGEGQRALALLDACEERDSPMRQLLKGRSLLLLGRYEAAAACLRKAETTHPVETAPLLEVCYRELGDFKRAYEYACKQR